MAIASSLAGCVTFGSEEYGCPGMPPGVKCKSAKQVYEDSINGEGDDSVGGRERVTLDRWPNAPWTNPPTLDAPQPLRAPPKIMRIWVTPFEDKNGDLHMPGLVYVEVEPRHWLVGDREVETSGRLTPLDVRSRSSAPVQPSKPPEGKKP